jgi:hypothetical protein
MDSRYNELESRLIVEYLPLLNIAGNPKTLVELRKLRDKCKQIARS